MELKTDGGIYLTKKEYRKNVTKVMDRQTKLALVAVARSMMDDDIDSEKIESAVNQALGLQMQALENMERVLFGKHSKKTEDKDEETEKND